MQSRFCWFTPILPKVKELFSSNKSGSSRFFLSHRIPASRAHRYPFVHLLVGGVAPKPPFHAVLRPAAAHLSAKRCYFQKPYLRKMPLSLLLFLHGLISLFHWLVQNSLHVRPNGQQFAHFVLCVSILGIILFSLHCQDFIFRLQRLNSRELRQFSLIKSGSVKFFL